MTDQRSRAALRWLIWEEYNQNIRFNMPANGKEVRILNYRFGGYFENGNEKKTAYELYGCFFHDRA